MGSPLGVTNYISLLQGAVCLKRLGNTALTPSSHQHDSQNCPAYALIQVHRKTQTLP